MARVLLFRSRRHIMREASEWVSRMDRGLDAREHEALQAWLASDRRCGTALVELAAVWDDMAILHELSDLFPLPASKRARRRRDPVVWGAGLAVAAALVLAWFSPLVQAPPATDLPTVASDQADTGSIISTMVGAQQTELLPDGSTVHLNTDSRIEASFEDTERRVVIHRGEVTFDVVPQPARPFTVVAGSHEIRAIGTAFNVRLREKGHLDVLVTEGEVLVKEVPSQSLPRREPEQPEAAREISLVAGELLMLGTQERQIRRVTAHESSARLAWQLGILVFNGDPLEAVLVEVARYTDLDFQIAQDELREIRVGGVFNASDIDGLLLSLSENFGIDVTRESEGTTRVITLSRGGDS